MVTTNTAPQRRLEIQGLRAVAVLLVVAFHAGLPLPGGFIGVDVFFAISGFVITRLLANELESTNSLDLREFYTRRIRRLLPALALTVAVVAVASCLLLSPLGPQQATARTGVAASTFVANIQLFRSPSGYFDLDAGSNALLHTWSLSVEEQFYLLFPTCLLAAWRLGSRRAATATVALATIASLAALWWTSLGNGDAIAHRLGGDGSRFAFYMPITRAWEFGAGMLAALVPSVRWKAWPAAHTALSIAGGLALLVSARWIHADAPWQVMIAPVLGTAVILRYGATSVVAGLLSARPMVWIGDVSYGWYLWHWPFVVFARAAWPVAAWPPLLAAVIALAAAAVSYRFVENKIRRNDRIVGKRVLALLAICSAFAVVCGRGLEWIAVLEAREPAAAELARSIERHADELRECNRGNSLDLERCRWPVDHSRGVVVLVGDSNAGHFTEAVASATTALGLELRVATRTACPFVDVLVLMPRYDTMACHRSVTDTLLRLIGTKPALVIVASASTNYIESDGIDLKDPRGGEVASSPGAKAQLWEKGTEIILSALSRAGIPTLLVHPVPQIDGPPNANCPFVRMLVDVDTCSGVVARADAETDRQLGVESERRAIARFPNVTAVDFADDLCSRATCASRVSGVWMYRDAWHLSVAGSMSLAPRFETLIRDHATIPTP